MPLKSCTDTKVKIPNMTELNAVEVHLIVRDCPSPGAFFAYSDRLLANCDATKDQVN